MLLRGELVFVDQFAESVAAADAIEIAIDCHAAFTGDLTEVCGEVFDCVSHGTPCRRLNEILLEPFVGTIPNFGTQPLPRLVQHFRGGFELRWRRRLRTSACLTSTILRGRPRAMGRFLSSSECRRPFEKE